MRLGEKNKISREWSKFEKCCDCGEEIEVKFNRGTQTWSRKNNLEFWTEKIRDVERYRCNNCWLFIYYKRPIDFSDMVVMPNRGKFLSYIKLGRFGEFEEMKKTKKKKKNEAK